MELSLREGRAAEKEADTVSRSLLLMGSVFVSLPTLKCIRDPQINVCGTFVVICRHAQGSEKFEVPDTEVPSGG